MILIVGFISGLEIPLLMNVGREISLTNKTYQVLAFDYMGTLIGAIIFPLVLLPYFNLFLIGFIVSLSNILVSLLVSLHIKNKKWIIICISLLSLWVLLIYQNAEISKYIINHFYFGGKIK
jgi:spermidine synthase